MFKKKKVVHKIKTHFVFNNFFFFENCAFYEIMRKNIVEPNRPQTKIWCMRIACCIPKATNTHSEYVILFVFPCNSGYTNASQCYAVGAVPVLFRKKSIGSGSCKFMVPCRDHHGRYLAVSISVVGLISSRTG